VDGDLTSSITSSGTVNTATEGTYTIVYSVSDADGNIASVSRTVIVSLDLPPTITLTGSATINLLVGDTYIENGCVATDALDGDLTSSIITSGTVDTSTVGTYTLVYSVTDSASNIVSNTRTVIVGEVCTSVTIELIDGSNSQTVISGNSISSINYQLTTDCPADANGNSLNSSAEGLPDGVTYSFSSENNTISINGTPTTQGTFNYSLNYYNSQTIENSTVSASVSGQIAVQQSTTSTATTNTSSCTISSPSGVPPGPFPLRAADGPGNTDQTIALGASIVDISGVYISNCGDALFASASGLPSGVTMTFSNNVGQTNGVNYSAISALIAGTPSSQTTGTYNYTVTVNDTSSNTFTYGGTITVIESSTNSSTRCSISSSLINGQASQTVTTGEAIANIGYDITTDCYGLLVSQYYSKVGPVDYSTNSDTSGLPPGLSMTFSNNIVNISGTITVSGNYYYDVVLTENTTTGPIAYNTITFSGTITVLSATSTSTTSSSTADTTPPVITLTGSSTINLTVGDTFTDPGATATDDVDGNITSSISISGSVDTSTAGTYTISYNVSDTAGNAATEAQRTVIVQ
jgi:hypothetical protein